MQPSLRFDPYNDALTMKTIEQLCTVTDCQHSTAPVIEGTSPFRMIRTSNVRSGRLITDTMDSVNEEIFHQWSVRGYLEVGDIVLTREAPMGEVAIIKRDDVKYFLGQRVLQLKPTSLVTPEYLHLLLQSNLFKKYLRPIQSNGSTVSNIRIPELKKMQFPIPSKKEQQEISSFFTLIDQKIEKQQEKVEQLELFNKGMIEKIFCQEVRFQDKNGQTLPKWRENTLEKLGGFKKSYAFSREVEGKGEYQHLHYGDIHSRYEGILETETEFPSITVDGPLETMEDGDVVFADASEDYKALGKAVVIWGLGNRRIVSGLHTHRFKPNEQIDSRFLMYFTKTKRYAAFIRQQGTGISVLGISKKNLSTLKVPLPSLEEQEKIVGCLSTLRFKIEKEKEKLVSLTELKKGLLQQMFI